jgi:prevent-host-death family protein
MKKEKSMKVSAAEFKKKSGTYQDMALGGETITITKHDRPSLVLLSFEEYQRLTGKTRRALHVTELSAKDLEAINASKVPEEQEHLNKEQEE